MKLKSLGFICAFFSIVGWGPFFSSTTDETSHAWIDQEIRVIDSQASNLDSEALRAGLTAYQKARQLGLDAKGLLTIIDYSKPSSEPRLWVVDLRRQKVLFNTWVTHGLNSGTLNATSFSNSVNSLKSSLGVYLTENAYSGHDGYSLRLKGLEPGVNDNAYRRSIVIHGAWYAGADVVRTYGMLGRSWGCMAVGRDMVRPLVNTIKDNTLVVAYYPDRSWLRNSSFLT